MDCGKLRGSKLSSNLGKVIAIRLLGISACWVFGQIRKDRMISFAAAKHPIQLALD